MERFQYCAVGVCMVKGKNSSSSIRLRSILLHNNAERVISLPYRRKSPVRNGLAWEGGDHTVLLQGLIDDFAITWTSTLDTAPQLFFDQTLNTTFIGYAAIPEPGSLSLLVGGGLLLGTLAARKGRRNS